MRVLSSHWPKIRFQGTMLLESTDLSNTSSKVAACITLMVIFVVDAVLYMWDIPESIWSYLALATVYVVSLLVAAGIVSMLNKS